MEPRYRARYPVQARVATLLVLLGLNACGGKLEQTSSVEVSASGVPFDDETEQGYGIPRNQVILFEVAYVHERETCVNSGIYLTASGEVLTYGNVVCPTQTTQAPYSAEITGAQIAAKFGVASRKIGTVAQQDLQLQYGRISSLAAGALYTYPPGCVDPGNAYYVAWSFDSVTDLYRPVILAVAGGNPRFSVSVDALAIADWLDAIYRPPAASADDSCSYSRQKCEAFPDSAACR